MTIAYRINDDTWQSLVLSLRKGLKIVYFLDIRDVVPTLLWQGAEIQICLFVGTKILVNYLIYYITHFSPFPISLLMCVELKCE